MRVTWSRVSLLLAMDIMDEDPVAPPLRPPLQNTSSPRDQEPLADEFEKLRQWQEARLARKLRGEYESAVIHLSELVRHPRHTAWYP